MQRKAAGTSDVEATDHNGHQDNQGQQGRHASWGKKTLNIIIGRIKNKDLSFLFTNDGEDGGMQESHVLLVSLLHAKLVEMSVGLE